VDVKEKYPEILDQYAHRLKGFYETAKYMLYHNQKQKWERWRYIPIFYKQNTLTKYMKPLVTT